MIKTDKDAFIYVSTKLLEQGSRCVGDSGDCQYRGYKAETISKINSQTEEEAKNYGLSVDNDSDFYDRFYDILAGIPYDAKCAVGHLISDFFYDESFEGQGIDEDIAGAVYDSNPEWKRSDRSFKMMSDLQTIHDRFYQDWNVLFESMFHLFDEDGNYINEDSVSKILTDAGLES